MLNKIRQLLWRNQTVGQTIFKNTFWLGISQIASRFIRIIIVVYAARILGAAGYGTFAYALAIIGFLNLFSDIGVNWILVREASKNTHQRQQYLSTTFAIKSALLVLLGLIILFIAPYFTKIPEARLLLPAMALLFMSDGLREFGFAVIRSLEKMELEASVNILTNTATVVISLAILTRYPTPYALALAYTTASLLGLFLTVYTLRGNLGNIFKGFSHQLIRPLFSAIWPFAATNILWSILTYTDVLMIGWLRTISEVGYYSAAQRPAQLLLALPGLVAISALPSMSRLAGQDDNKFRWLIEQTVATTMLLALPIVSGSFLLGNQLINILYGSEYSPTGIIFIILITAFLITFPVTIVNNAIFSRGRQKEFLPYMATGAVLNIVLNITLIPRYGATGAAVATVLSQALAYGWIILVAQRRIKFVIWPLLPKTILATLVMTTVVWLSVAAGLGFYLIVLLAIVAYFATLIISRESLLLRLATMLKRIS